jgi:two-component system, chemotaxis family, CheB/CheR fusion protein
VVTLKDVKVGTNGGTQVLDITVQPVTSPVALRGLVMVVFTDVAKPSAAKVPHSSGRATIHNARLAAMAQELQRAHMDLQSSRDEMQTSQEELKSTNEELQSMNEELQSTNEELTTSKEEMQSMNEELQTVNHELQAKVDELSRAGNDMKNLLNSTDIATLFLDDALLVRRFTTQTASIIKLIPGDVGRPITDIVTALDYPRLANDAQGVLRTLIFVEKQVSARDGRWFTVRIMPYRTQDNRIDGLVITFADITVAKNLETALRKAQADLEKRFTTQKGELGKARKNLQTESKRHPPAKPGQGPIRRR